MNKTLFFRILMATVIMFAAGTGAEAQGLKGLAGKIKDKAEKTTGRETGQTSAQEAGQATGRKPAGAVGKAAALKQPWAVDESGKGDVQATFADGVLTIKGTGRMKNYTVLIQTDDRPWAAHANDIQTVIVDEGVTYLSSPAFYKCENLTSVSLPGTLTAIGEGAFYGCKSLPTITLPKSLSDFSPGKIPNEKGGQDLAGLFEQCTMLIEIKVEAGNAKYKSVDGVLYEALGNKYRLKAYPPGRTATKFIVPDNTPVIQTGAFASCQAIKELVLPVSCGTLQDAAFKDCINLQSLTLNQPSGVVSLSKRVFEGVDMTKIKITVPQKLLNDYKTRPDYDWRDWAGQFVGK